MSRIDEIKQEFCTDVGIDVAEALRELVHVHHEIGLALQNGVSGTVGQHLGRALAACFTSHGCLLRLASFVQFRLREDEFLSHEQFREHLSENPEFADTYGDDISR